jgi:hypothetical protein
MRVATFAFVLVGCSHTSSATPPEFSDGRNASDDWARTIPAGNAKVQPQAKCDHDVRVLTDDQLALGSQAYDVVSEITVSCGDGKCDERLRVHACALGADVVVLKAQDARATDVTAHILRLKK